MKDISNINNLREIGLFNEGDYLIFGFKKTEKIVSAIYLISSLIKDNEPLKWEVRDDAISLISLMMTLNNSAESHKTGALQSYYASSLRLKSLLGVADNAGLVSSMNARLISEEIDLLIEFLKKHSTHMMSKGGYILSDSFFSTDMKAPEIGDQVAHSDQHKRHIHQASDHKKGQIDELPIKDKKDSRQTSILGLLQKKSNLTIKDFVKVITDCSEKTIQRELIDLVEKGTVIKVGERRWSTYSLKA
ncbi:MAG: hypothetical protein V4697_04050 [Patescibacteria group bacterium]